MDHDVRLIEAGFPCHQVGAETQRGRGASSALPPLYYLHVWWARRPLTPSRAAILASLLPADTDPEWFLRQLGIEKPVAEVNGATWVLTGPVLDRVERTKDGSRVLPVDERMLTLLAREDARRVENRGTIMELTAADTSLANDPVLQRWQQESQPIPKPWPEEGETLPVQMVAADPAHVNARIALAKSERVQKITGKTIQLSPQDLYGYGRAFTSNPVAAAQPKVVLDPTSGGGSIPFEALRLGHTVIANELNPVASVILHATLEYPARFGESLVTDISHWGNKLLEHVAAAMADATLAAPLNGMREIAGPERVGLAALVTRYLDALGDTRTVVADANAPYFGAPLTNDSLTPGANPHLGAVGFDAWFAKAQKAKAAKVASV